MAFVRIKKVKGKQYAYLVQNNWRKGKIRKRKGVKQKVKAYLGRVYRLVREKDIDFWQTVDSEPETYLRLATKKKILHDLIRFELLKHGFVNVKEDALKKDSGEWMRGDIRISINKKKIVNKLNSKCVLAINEGYLCGYMLKKLFNYDVKGPIEESGLELARLFIETGLNVPQEVFIEYYEKL
ncbi:hypothetical protein KY345_05400 [Candidatus Woesearchaeota archaeon]|nr:hypothetical protein [Candidatus Woesearchaeota archaeon]